MSNHHIPVNAIVLSEECPVEQLRQMAKGISRARQEPRGSFLHLMCLLIADAYEDRLFHQHRIIVDVPDGGPALSREERTLIAKFELH